MRAINDFHNLIIKNLNAKHYSVFVSLHVAQLGDVTKDYDCAAYLAERN